MASKYLKRFHVPKTFEEILSDFTKEILRTQPKDIIEFGIEYFKALESNPNATQKYKINEDNYKKEDKRKKDVRVFVENKLEISNEDKNRLQNSMEKIDRISNTEKVQNEQNKIEKEKKEKEIKIKKEEEQRKEVVKMGEKESKNKKESIQIKNEVKIGDYQYKKDNNINEKNNLKIKEEKENWYSKCFIRLVDDFKNDKVNITLSLNEDQKKWYSRCYIRLVD